MTAESWAALGLGIAIGLGLSWSWWALAGEEHMATLAYVEAHAAMTEEVRQEVAQDLYRRFYQGYDYGLPKARVCAN